MTKTSPYKRRQAKPASAGEAKPADKGNDARTGEKVWEERMNHAVGLFERRGVVQRYGKQEPPKWTRRLLFSAAEIALGKRLASYDADTNRLHGRNEREIRRLMYRSGVIARRDAKDAKSENIVGFPSDWRTLEPLPALVDGGLYRCALDSVWDKTLADGEPCLRFTGARADELLCEARKGGKRAHHAWLACQRLAAAMVMQGDPLPLGLREFAAAVVRGEFWPPRARGRSSKMARDAALRSVASEMEFQHGFRPLTRNRASKGCNSICDALVAALKSKSGEGLSYEALEKIVGKPRTVRNK